LVAEKWVQTKIQDKDSSGEDNARTKFCPFDGPQDSSDPTLRPDSLASIWQLLDQIPDPEIPVVSIRELGILRDVRESAPGQIEVVITPTYSGCPAIGQIEDDVRSLLAREGIQAEVVTQLAPAWTTDWISAEAKDKLRAYGIAPPQHASANHNVIQFAPILVANSAINTPAIGRFGLRNVPCPRCSSHNTTETSHFASTACKALYKCLDCLEPFDYFKPY
jgi:ring-1,2-phenylacetyl-CoA epoxidase subunit PaaD